MHQLSTTSLFGIAIILLIVGGLLFAWANNTKDVQILSITTFEECAAAGYPIMESYPEQCATPDGRTFVKEYPPTEEEGFGLQANGCAVAGCSGQLCVSADEAGNIVTTCEYRAEYACYSEASCEPQADGMCGWTETTELKACLKNPPQMDEMPQVY